MTANDDVDYVALIVHVIFGLKAQKYIIYYFFVQAHFWFFFISSNDSGSILKSRKIKTI